MSRGIRYMLIATFTFTLMKVGVKMVPHIPPIEIIFFRSIISLIISAFALRLQRISIWGTNKPILIARGVSGAIALFLYFTLLQQIPLATASTLQYLAPVFTSILAIFLLREKVRSIQWLFFFISFIGIVTVQGFDTRISLSHLLIGITASFFMGLAYNFIRMLKTSEHPLVIILYFPLVTLPIAGIISIFQWVHPQGLDWIVLISIGILTQIAQYFMTRSYQNEEVNRVAIVNYTGLIYSLGFGFIIFGETFNLMTYLGMALVLAGVILNLVFKK
ncbi:MAG: DMT family transporter [Cyclobacteriaceae bacterium]